MATDLLLIVDSTSFAVNGTITVSGSPWTSLALFQPSVTMYKGTGWFTTGPGSFFFSFDGTSVAIIGISPSSPSQSSTVTIDGTVFSVDHNDSSPYTYRPWFQSPNLVDGIHEVQGNCSTGTVLDFAIVTAGTRTQLSAESVVFVDDDSPSILYSGDWTHGTSEFNATAYFGGYAYGNSTHRSSTPGDTFTFRFRGRAVSVYGMFFPNNLGVLAATFTIDGATVPQIHNITQITSFNREIPNYLHYSLGNLGAGDHTLIVNVTVAHNHTFVLDYITYTPSFTSAFSMPLLSNTTTTTSLSMIKSSPSVGEPSSQPSQVQTSGTPQPSPIRTTAIFSGVIGVLALVLVAILGRWVFLRWRKTKKAEDESLSVREYSENDAGNPHGEQQQMRQLQPMKYRGLNLPSDPDPFSSIPRAEVVTRLPRKHIAAHAT